MSAGDEALLAELLGRNAQNAAIYRLCEQYIDRFDNDNDWEPETNGEIALLRKVMPKCRVIFDVGSHTGNWAAAALAINPELEIHCFEASLETHRRLVGRSPPLRVIANPFGLGAVAETRTLYSYGAGASGNSLYRRSGLEPRGFATQNATETATLDTVDGYCARRGIDAFDFMKIDTEGHELYVLQGARGLLAGKAIGAVQFEYGGCNIDSRVLLRDIFEFLAEVDYVPAKVMRDHVALVTAYDARLENFRYQNWLAVPAPAADALMRRG
ncbi:MAG TPA: FkbM family methyltransferase [Candidatus Sulfotelmatobacter sp.]|nr:FkbM family methyltransferase [Candidatus Sulfotelmatobacter sp.]